jgi:Cu(I)/Ag(I) efflux system periplasmic protein CusF
MTRRTVLLNGLARLTLVAGLALHGVGVWAQALADGEVRKVDVPAGKLTIRHGPLTELEMPAMTMVFRVADPKLLDELKPGDKIRFVATRDGGVFTVTRVELVR